MSEPERDRTIARDDVDDVVGVASELAEAEQARVRIADMKEIAADLAIDPKHVEPAIETLAERRRQEVRREAQAAAARRTWLARGGAAVAVVLGLTVGCGLWTRSALAPRWVEVERARSQVETVVARRAEVESIWRDRAAGIDRDAELAGAENRVGVERRRYDDSAADYNTAAASLPHAWLCGLVGVPCRAPLASEIPSFSR